MAGQFSTFVRCPDCEDYIELGVTLRLEMKRMVVGIDTAPVHAHLTEHHAPPPPHAAPDRSGSR